MSAAFVLDASVALAWCFEDETSPYSESALRHLATNAAVAPTVWPLEVVNALLIAERRKRITTTKVDLFLKTLQVLPIEVVEEDASRVFDQVAATAREHGLTSYDSSYLCLAAQRGIPLATLDGKLRKAAESVGVPIWEPVGSQG